MSAGTPTVPTGKPPRWANAVMCGMLHTPGLQKLLGRQIALLTVTGRRSGRTITTPVTYVRDGGTVTVITKAFRTWWRNLEDRPEVVLRLAGQQHAGRASVNVGDPRALPDFLAFLRLRRQDARAYGVTFGENDRPNEEQAAAILPHLVIIRIELD